MSMNQETPNPPGVFEPVTGDEEARLDHIEKYLSQLTLSMAKTNRKLQTTAKNLRKWIETRPKTGGEMDVTDDSSRTEAMRALEELANEEEGVCRKPPGCI